MSRADKFKSSSSNPATFWMEWSSDNKCLKYWDKESEKQIQVPLPFKFLVLEEAHKAGGYSEKHSCGVFSNEILSMKNETVKVQLRNAVKTVVADGLWNDIKGDVADAGGKYYKSLYVMTPKGAIINLSFAGASVSPWFEFTKKTKSRLADEWVSISGFEEAKKGKVEYSFPVFEFSGATTKEEYQLADELEAKVAEHFKGSPEKEVEEVEEISKAEESEDNSDELPF